MEHMDMIDKLKEKAGITREEAADALTRADWDMLEALVILEREGRIAPLTSSVVTADNTYGQYNQYNAANRYNYGYNYGTRTRGVQQGGFMEKLRTLARNSVVYSLFVRRNGRVLISLPVLVFVVILLAAFRITAVALLIGLFCGCKYSLEKRDSQTDDPADGGDGNEGNGV